MARFQTVTASPADVEDPGIALVTVFVDTSSGSWVAAGQLNLPPTPTAKARVLIKDSGGQAGVKSIVVNGNSNDIDGDPTRTIQNPFEALLLVYTGARWVVI